MQAITPIHTNGENAFWISATRAVAMFMIILHNWCSVFSRTDHSGFGGKILKLFLPFSGSFIQLFFIISGSGLVIWFYRNPYISWKQFFKRRLFKIILPYWIAASLFFVLINYANMILPDFFLKSFDLKTLLKYLLLIQNQYPEIWDFNRSYWFLPVIIHLYLIFPVLLYLQRKTFPLLFIIIIVVISVSSIFLWEMRGFRLSNLSSIFPFFTAQFALGMIIGKTYLFNRDWFDRLYTTSGLIMGVLLYFFAFLFATYIPLGHFVNDIFSASGLFLIVNYMIRFTADKDKIVSLIKRYSGRTYVLYLVHLFIIVYFLKPFISERWDTELSSYTIFITGIGFNVILFFAVDFSAKLQKRLFSKPGRH